MPDGRALETVAQPGKDYIVCTTGALSGARSLLRTADVMEGVATTTMSSSRSAVTATSASNSLTDRPRRCFRRAGSSGKGRFGDHHF